MGEIIAPIQACCLVAAFKQSSWNHPRQVDYTCVLLYQDPWNYIYLVELEMGMQNHGCDNGSVLISSGELCSDDRYPLLLPAQWTRGWSIHLEKKFFPKLTYFWGRAIFDGIASLRCWEAEHDWVLCWRDVRRTSSCQESPAIMCGSCMICCIILIEKKAKGSFGCGVKWK